MPHHALARYEAVGPHRTARHLVPGVGTFYHPSDPPPEGTGTTLGRACIAAAAANGRWPGE